MRNYARQDVAFEYGAGCWLYDTSGQRYLDAIGGLAVNVLGHAHAAVTQAITGQAARLIHTSNIYRIPAQEQLAARLTALTGLENAFFCNSGAEANEAAIKLARLYGHRRNIATPQIIVMDGAFHGRTMATLTATGTRKAQAGFEPLLSGFVRCPWNDLDALQLIARQRNDVVAIMVEPIQGEGGVRVPAPGYLRALRTLCDEKGWLLICDEIQTGMFRTGTFLASMQDQVQPDIVTLAKGLGNGIPIGTCLAGKQAADLFEPGKHGSTFGGNPLACHTALAVLDVLEAEALGAHAATVGQFLRERLAEQLAGLSMVREIRGQGLMIGIELREPAPDLVSTARAHGLLINVTADKVIRLLPPLILDNDEATQLCDLLVPLIAQLEPARETTG